MRAKRRMPPSVFTPTDSLKVGDYIDLSKDGLTLVELTKGPYWAKNKFGQDRLTFKGVFRTSFNPQQLHSKVAFQFGDGAWLWKGPRPC